VKALSSPPNAAMTIDVGDTPTDARALLVRSPCSGERGARSLAQLPDPDRRDRARLGVSRRGAAAARNRRRCALFRGCTSHAGDLVREAIPRSRPPPDRTRPPGRRRRRTAVRPRRWAPARASQHPAPGPPLGLEVSTSMSSRIRPQSLRLPFRLAALG
jgi:hypothetical protein